jgi:excisionase family DNA binding protein
MAKKPLTLPEVADQLGVHYMTAYRYVRTGRLPAKRVAGTWQVDPAELEKMRKAERGTGERRPTGVIPAREHLELRLLASDEPGAWEIVEAALGSGMEPETVLLEVIAPTLRSIGELWEQGKLGIADEHRASATATRLISRLGARFGRRGHKRGTVIVTAPAGEMHSVPIAMAANLLRWHGFGVVELGADTPAEALAEAAIAEPDLVAVAIGCTAKNSPQAARRAIAALRVATPKVPVLLGGAAITTATQAKRLGADMFTGGRADEIVHALEAIVGTKQ